MLPLFTSWLVRVMEIQRVRELSDIRMLYWNLIWDVSIIVIWGAICCLPLYVWTVHRSFPKETVMPGSLPYHWVGAWVKRNSWRVSRLFLTWNFVHRMVWQEITVSVIMQPSRYWTVRITWPAKVRVHWLMVLRISLLRWLILILHGSRLMSLTMVWIWDFSTTVSIWR